MTPRPMRRCACGRPYRPGQRTCKRCHAAAMRETRKRKADELRKLRAELKAWREGR